MSCTTRPESQVQAGAADPLDLLNARLELGVSELAQLDGRLKLQLALGALEERFAGWAGTGTAVGGPPKYGYCGCCDYFG